MARASILRGREWWIWKQRRSGRDDEGNVRLRTVYPERIQVGRPGHELPYLPCSFRMTDEQMAVALLNEGRKSDLRSTLTIRGSGRI